MPAPLATRTVNTLASSSSRSRNGHVKLTKASRSVRDGPSHAGDVDALSTKLDALQVKDRSVSKQSTNKSVSTDARPGKRKEPQVEKTPCKLNDAGLPPMERSKLAMRAVNAACQTLTSVVQSGWKATTQGSSAASTSVKQRAPVNTKSSSDGDPVCTLESVTAVVTSCRSALIGLRGLREQMEMKSLDIERAAVNLAGKLVGLEMWDMALEILSESHKSVVGLYHEVSATPNAAPVTPMPPSARTPKASIRKKQTPARTTGKASDNFASRFSLLRFPLPQGDESMEDAVLNLVASSQVYALHALVHRVDSASMNRLVATLSSDGTLLDFIPNLQARLGTGSVSSFLTSSFRVIATNLSSSFDVPPAALFAVRSWALRCLVRADGINPNDFWEQSMRWGGSYMRPAAQEGDAQGTEAYQEVDGLFKTLVALAGQRTDAAQFRNDSGFAAFCDWWISAARKKRDFDTISYITRVLADDVSLIASLSEAPSQNLSKSQGRRRTMKEDTATSLSKACTKITHAEMILDRYLAVAEDQNVAAHLEDAVLIIENLAQLYTSGAEGINRLQREVERLRRSCVKARERKDDRDADRDAIQISAGLVLNTSAKTAEDVLAMPDDDAARPQLTAELFSDLITGALDSLLVLARTTLVPTQHDTHRSTSSYLDRATLLARRAPAQEAATFLRCISAAYHNATVAMYKAGKASFGVLFAEAACSLGREALQLRGAAGESEKVATEWESLTEQMGKRCELLASCYLKRGDKKLAYHAYADALSALPPTTVDALRQASACEAISIIFARYGPLSILIDRLTSLATSDLLLLGKEISLRGHLEERGLPKEIIGAILEYQVLSLDPTLHKTESFNAVGSILDDLLSVYDRTDFPIRGSRVRLRKLEHLYHMQSGFATATIASEILESLASRHRGQDEGLQEFVTQYQALTHLWLAFHAYFEDGPSSTPSVTRQAGEAIRILRSFVVQSPTSPTKLVAPVPKSAAHPKPSSRQAAAKTPRKATTPRVIRSAMNSTLVPRTPQVNGSVTQGKRRTTLDNAGRVYKQLEMMSRLLGWLGLTFARLQLLDVMRHMNEEFCEDPSGCDGILHTCTELAYEHARLGKTSQASHLYTQAMSWSLHQGCSAPVSDEARAWFFLRYADSLATQGSSEKSLAVYEEARALVTSVSPDEPSSTAARIRARVNTVERSALAASVHASIQESMDETITALASMAQSLRLWNRALDNLSRISPSTSQKENSQSAGNPFSDDGNDPKRKPPRKTGTSLDGLHWRIAQGLYHALLSLSKAYCSRGSPRESEYFIQQAIDLAEGLKAPILLARALAHQGELKIFLGDAEEGSELLGRSTDLLEKIRGPDLAEAERITADNLLRQDDKVHASELYVSATSILQELEDSYRTVMERCHTPRKLKTATRLGKASRKSGPEDIVVEAMLPLLQASILRKHVWLLREDDKDFESLLTRLLSLPPIGDLKAEERALLGHLHLHDAYAQFRSDLFLSSLTESTIALPMGMSSRHATVAAASSESIMSLLDEADQNLWEALELMSHTGRIAEVRNASISIALIRAFQTSLGKASKKGPGIASALLEMSCGTTLRRQMLETIEMKLSRRKPSDDLIWPGATPSASISTGPSRGRQQPNMFEEEDLPESEDETLDPYRVYWEATRERYRAMTSDVVSTAGEQIDLLPNNWTVVSINVSEDKSTMLIARHRPHHEPLMFCLPLDRQGRREGDDEQFTFEHAIDELNDIVRKSNEGTRIAKSVEGRDAKASWWAERAALDNRLSELLDNIEYCWLGAFKTILSEPNSGSPQAFNTLRSRFDKIFKPNVVSSEKGSHARMRLDDNILQCFSSLSPKCRDEELEDLVYFVLDLYQFHGVPIAVAEIDIDELVTDLRTALEEFSSKLSTCSVTSKSDQHLFLVLDKNVQGIPWESMPLLRGRSVSRIPSISFLVDRIHLVRHQSGLPVRTSASSRIVDSSVDRVDVDPKKTFYVLNPSGDLTRTEHQFAPWLKNMGESGWRGIVGRPPMEGEMLRALESHDLILYFGHGGGEQYLRSHQIRNLPRCGAVMLWGCSSGALRNMGEFDSTGTPHNYILAGCPSIVATLWDVTDRDIDRLSDTVFQKLRLNKEGVQSWTPDRSKLEPATSVVKALSQSRDVCKLKFLTGAAPVVYGIPYYL